MTDFDYTGFNETEGDKVMKTKVHIIEVTLRMAVVATDTGKALEVAKETMQTYSGDGSLSDMLVYEWDDPVFIREEETATE